jgi:hypothetical protein
MEPYRLRRRTTSSIERFNEEMRRRQRVIRIFPTSESALRLLGALLMEQDEGWTTGERLPLQQSRWYLEEGRTWGLYRLQVARHRIAARLTIGVNGFVMDDFLL